MHTFFKLSGNTRRTIHGIRKSLFFLFNYILERSVDNFYQSNQKFSEPVNFTLFDYVLVKFPWPIFFLLVDFVIVSHFFIYKHFFN